MNTEEEILDAVIQGGSTDLAAVVCWLTLSPGEWCIIGGAAVNSYSPSALYDDHLDIAFDREPGSCLLSDLSGEGFAVRVDERAHVAHATRPGNGHRLRVCLYYGPAYRSMPGRASRRAVLGTPRPVASLPDVEQGLLLVRDDPGQGWHEKAKAEIDLVRLAERDLELAGVDGWGESCAA